MTTSGLSISISSAVTAGLSQTSGIALNSNHTQYYTTPYPKRLTYPPQRTQGSCRIHEYPGLSGSVLSVSHLRQSRTSPSAINANLSMNSAFRRCAPSTTPPTRPANHSATAVPSMALRRHRHSEGWGQRHSRARSAHTALF